MTVTTQQAEKLLRGNQAFSQLGFSMMLQRMKTGYSKDPSQAALQAYTKEINVFLAKFNMIMGADYAIIAKL